MGTTASSAVGKAVGKTAQAAARLTDQGITRLPAAEAVTRAAAAEAGATALRHNGAVIVSSAAAQLRSRSAPASSCIPPETLADVQRRIDSQRPATFRRLDAVDDASASTSASSGGSGSSVDVDSGTAVDNVIPTRDEEAADIARQANVLHERSGEFSTAVSVTRLKPSRILPATGDGGGSSSLHDKSPVTTANLRELDQGERHMRVAQHADDSPGTRNFKVYQAMQMNPGLLDTAAALASSPLQLIAAQMAAGIIPASARAEILQIPPGRGSGGQQLLDASSEVDVGGSASTSLVTRAAAAEALVPAHATVDSLLLAQREGHLPDDLVAWGPRPAEGSPYDQLILAPADDEFTLERGEVFELYARHRADPVFWTAERLAEKYATKVMWVEVLLEYGAPPLYSQVDGEPYGVYDIRTMDDLQRQDEDESQRRREEQARKRDVADAAFHGQLR